MHLFLIALLCVPAANSQNQPMPDIGPTIIPFYTGNLSVDSFMYYWGTRKEPPTPQVTPESIAQLKRTSCFAICDYPAWCLIEKERGHWDFSLYKDNAEKLRQAGIKYNVFCWLHFPPKWYLSDPEFVPYRCLEHNEPLNQMSLWAPSTRHIYEEFYRQLAAAMGREIAFIRLAMPSEYGEIGFPVGMTNWLMPQPHVHQGFWCGDPEARKSFRSFAVRRYRTIAALNNAWGTSFNTNNEIDYPSVTEDALKLDRQPSEVKARLRWLDFIDWYNQSWTDFMVFAANVVKANFPGFGLPQPGADLRTRHEIIASLGYGSEVPSSGNDQARHIAAMKKAGLSAQTPGDIGYFATRRVSSACSLYGVPYYTEPPGDVIRNREVQRIWMDASNGTQVFFDYPPNLDGARDLFAEYKTHLNGRRSIAEIGLLLPTSTLYLHPDWGWPPYLEGFSETLRDRADYEMLDERMIADGGLRRFNTRILIVASTEYLQKSTLELLSAWVKRGGVLISLQTAKVLDWSGSADSWTSMMPEPPQNAASPIDYKDAWTRLGRQMGRGRTVMLTGGPVAVKNHAEVVADITAHLGDLLPGTRNGRMVDAEFDGIRASLFKDRILYYNASDAAAAKRLQFRAEDFGGEIGKPEKLEMVVNIPAHGILSVPLRK